MINEEQHNVNKNRLTCENHKDKEAEYMCSEHLTLLCINCAWRHGDHKKQVSEIS